MKRPNAVTIVTILAFLFAGSAALMVYSYLKKQGGKQAEGVAVVTAATEIAIGTKLEPGQLKLATWPKESLPPGNFTNAAPLAGRVAVRHISAGDVITEPKLMPIDAAKTGGVMTYIIPQGHRAVTVAVNEVAGVAGFITPNSRVDIVLTTPLPGTQNSSNEVDISKVILQNIPVLATGQVTEQKDGKPTIVPTVTLDLAPDDAEKIIVGTNVKKGALQLLLRNAIDIAAIDTRGATIPKVLGRDERPVPVKVIHKSAPAKAAPVKPPPVVAKYTLEVIKGGAKSTREFAAE